MNDSQWDAKFKSFLKKTGEDFKRFGADVKTEAQKLMSEVKDPERQAQMREGLKDLGVFAKRTADEVTTLVEQGVKYAEGALKKAPEKAKDFVNKPVAEPAATPPSPPPVMEEDKAPAPKPSRPKKAAAKKPAAKKTIGKKKKS